MNSKNLLGKFCYPILQYQHNFKKSTHFLTDLKDQKITAMRRKIRKK